MEVLRPEVCQRLVLWVSAAGGGQRAAGEEFGRKSTEVTGELRAQYAALLRRAVAGVAQAGPSLHQALRQVAAKPPGAAFKRTKREPRGGPAGGALHEWDGPAPRSSTSPLDLGNSSLLCVEWV